MARVTVEDCILNIPNRFELVVTAAQRAKQISSGMPLTIDRDNDKDAVVSLREIADKTIDLSLVNEEVIQHFMKRGSGFDPADQIEDEEQYASTNLVTEAFEDARQYIQPGDQAGGMSFVEENVEVDD